MTTYIVAYKTRRGGDLKITEVRSVQELMEWIRKHADRCCVVMINRIEE